MAHLNLYLPDDVADILKHEANAARVPLSRYVSSLLAARGSGEEGWPPDYFERVCGFMTEDMAEPEDLPPEPVEELELRRR